MLLNLVATGSAVSRVLSEPRECTTPTGWASWTRCLEQSDCPRISDVGSPYRSVPRILFESARKRARHLLGSSTCLDLNFPLGAFYGALDTRAVEPIPAVGYAEAGKPAPGSARRTPISPTQLLQTRLAHKGPGLRGYRPRPAMLPRYFWMRRDRNGSLTIGRRAVDVRPESLALDARLPR